MNQCIIMNSKKSSAAPGDPVVARPGGALDRRAFDVVNYADFTAARGEHFHPLADAVDARARAVQAVSGLSIHPFSIPRGSLALGGSRLRRELVAVRPGLFDTTGGRVQVEGGVREGDRVVVPSP